jgi:hypothetical protein
MTRDYVLDQGFAEERVALSRGRRRWRVDGPAACHHH